MAAGGDLVPDPEAVADAFRKIWQILKAVFDQGERLCRACKYAVILGRLAVTF